MFPRVSYWAILLVLIISSSCVSTAVDSEQPTFADYQNCHEIRNECITECGSAMDKVTCVDQCPICPILIDQNVIVNESNRSSALPVNARNIIRLTNEIHNIIDNNNRTNTTTQIENKLYIQKKTALRTGGLFGLGYNEKGACCIVVRPIRNCNAKNCHKRTRHCGKHCKARVMFANLVEKCNDPMLHNRNCTHTIEYVPYNSSIRKRREPRCRYMPVWPFVTCATQNVALCQQCLALPYGYILQHGIPSQCIACYAIASNSHLYSSMATPPLWDVNALHLENEYLPSWNLERVKCRISDDTIGDDCIQRDINYNDYDLGSGEGQMIQSEDNQLNNNDYLMNDVNGMRRQIFRRSAYSRRGRKNI